MSWDVVIHTEGDIAPLGTSGEVRNAVSGTLPSVRWSDDHWGSVTDGELSLEFNLGSEEPVGSMMIHVRGAGDPMPGIVDLCKAQGWAATDLTTGEEIDLLNPSSEGWSSFVAFRSEVVGRFSQDHAIVLPHSRLKLDGDALYRVAGEKVLFEHKLGEIRDLRFERVVSPLAIGVALVFFAAAIAAATQIANRWIGIPLTLLLSFAGLFNSLASFGDAAKFTSREKKHCYWLIGRPDEVASFRTALRDAVTGAQG